MDLIIAFAIFMTAMIFSLSTGVIMCRQCMDGNYPDTRESRTDLMLGIENSAVPPCGLVPWCIACSVPL